MRSNTSKSILECYSTNDDVRIATGSILVFVSSIGMFVVSDVMGGSKVALIGNVIQNQFLGARDWPFGSALSMIVVLFSVLLIYLYYRATKVYKYDGNGGNRQR